MRHGEVNRIQREVTRNDWRARTHSDGSIDVGVAATRTVRRDPNRVQTPLSPAAFFAAIFLPLLVLYLATAQWHAPYGVDATANALTAFELATGGDVVFEDHTDLLAPHFRGRGAWLTGDKNGQAVSQYPPGAALLAAPVYAIWPDRAPQRWEGQVDEFTVSFTTPPIGPAAITAAVAVAAGLAMLGLAIRPLTDDRVAMGAVYVLALATGVWTVAADRLWLHSADVMYLSAGLYLSGRRTLAGGLSFGMAALTRPHTMLIAAGAGLGRAFDARRWSPALWIGIGTATGIAVLIAYNLAVFGTASLSGGYELNAADFITATKVDFLPNVFGAFFDLRRGIFIYSPFLLVLLPGLRTGWKASPSWVQGAALGGIAYLVVQLAANRFSGGGGFWGYRYPIEALVAVTPLLTVAYSEWTSRTTRRRRLFAIALGTAFAIHLVGALNCFTDLC